MKNVVIKSLGLLMLLGNVLSPATTPPKTHIKYNWDHIVMAFTERTCSTEPQVSVLKSFKALLNEMRDNGFNFKNPGIVQKAIICPLFHTTLPLDFIEALLEMDVDVRSKSPTTIDMPFPMEKKLTPLEILEALLQTTITGLGSCHESRILEFHQKIDHLQKTADLLRSRIPLQILLQEAYDKQCFVQ